jgi:hypothetical protein
VNLAEPELIKSETDDIRKMLNEWPTYSVYLQTTYGCAETGALVAVDCLARLSEAADLPKDRQLAIVTARLHAWHAITR